MERDIGDIIDRYTIVMIKKTIIKSPETIKEFDFLDGEIKKFKEKHIDLKELDMLIKIMQDMNLFQWNLEDGIKIERDSLKNPNHLLDKNNRETLSNVGLIAILIRYNNMLRTQIKNLINKLAKEGFQDEKNYY